MQDAASPWGARERAVQGINWELTNPLKSHESSLENRVQGAPEDISVRGEIICLLVNSCPKACTVPR